eukprot:Nk52_evm1s1372 gene=Nk52_evmTU1s1372
MAVVKEGDSSSYQGYQVGGGRQGGSNGQYRSGESYRGCEGAAAVVVRGGEEEGRGGGRIVFNWRKFLHFAGPGLLMSISYVDPGNFESDLQAGAKTGYKLLWVLLWSTVVGLFLQLMAARLGVATGRHLAEHCAEQYPPAIKYTLWVLIEIAVIGSDIQEVIGSSIAINILSNGYVPLWAGTLITVCDTFTFLFLENYGIRKLEIFFGTLIGIMTVTLGVEYAISKPDQLAVLEGVVLPRVDASSAQTAMALIGAVIMPHNMYLHSALVQSRKVHPTDKRGVREAYFYFKLESALSLAVSFVINLFVIAVFAKGFYNVPGIDVDDIGLRSAGEFLLAKYGQFSYIVWGVGLLASGQSSTMTGTYSGQFIMQGFLRLKISPWKRIMITRSIAVIPAFCVAFLSADKLDKLGQYLNILQSLILSFAVIPLLKFTSSRKIMGGFEISRMFRCVMWVCASVLIVINMYLLVSNALELLYKSVFTYGLFGIVLMMYFLFNVALVFVSTNDGGDRKDIDDGQEEGWSSSSSTSLLGGGGGNANRSYGDLNTEQESLLGREV